MKNLKKVISVMLCMALLFTTMPMVVANAEGDEPLLELNTPYEITLDGDLGEIVKYRFSPEKDGWYKFYSTGEADPYIDVYTSGDDFYGGSDDASVEDYNFNAIVYMYAGNTYYLDVCVNDEKEASFIMMVEEAVAVESVEITKEPDNTTVIEGNEYDTMDLGGLEAKITLEDGTEHMWSYDNYDLIEGYEVTIDCAIDDQGRCYIDVVCGDASDRFFFETVENPVSSIEYSCDEVIEIYENSCGYFNVDMDYYIYYNDLPEDAIITINYTDGTSVNSSVYEPVDDVFIYWYDDQYVTPWSVGSDNYITVEYFGVTTKVPVTILPCPIKNVVINSEPTREYVFGDGGYGYLDEEGLYELYPYDFTGLSFTVEYEDGSTQQYDDKDIDTEYGEIDGYEFTCDTVIVEAPGVVEVTLNYKGYDIKYNVNVIETPIESIEVLSDPYVTEYEYRYYPVFDGMQIKLTFKDGTSETVTLSDENTEYILDDDLSYLVTVGDYEVSIEYSYDFGTDTYYYYMLSCLGVIEEYRGITFTENRVIEDIVFDKFTDNGDLMQVTVTYKDGTKETLHYDAIKYYCDNYGEVEGIAKTENGIDYYAIYPDFAEDGTVVGYYLYLLEEETYYSVAQEPSVMLGDVDGSGNISVLDATAIQRYKAQLVTLDVNALLAADVDKDGNVTVLDATRIQRFLAQLITEL